MVQKPAMKTRSKSASRSEIKTSSRSKSKSSSRSPPPSKSKPRRSKKIDTKYSESDDKSSDLEINETKVKTRKSAPVSSRVERDDSSDEVVITRRMTRQSIKVIEQENNETVAFDMLSDDETKTEKKSKKSKIISKNKYIFMKIMNTLIIFAVVLLLPLIVIFMNKMCESGGHIRLINMKELKLEYFANFKIMGIMCGWLLFLVINAILPIGTVKSKRVDIRIVRYRCNGILSLVFSLIILGGLYYYGKISPKWFERHYYEILGSTIVISYLISILVFIKSFFVNRFSLVEEKENYSNGFIFGRESNPGIFHLDLRFFYEFRPGIVTWAIISIIYALLDLENRGFKSFNWSLLFVSGAQFVYCMDALIFEGDLVSKSFINQGRFGFIHCFGNQVIVPFLFTLTTRAVYLNKFSLPLECVAGIGVVNLVGFVLYRTSNWQKNSFRNNPYSINLSHLKTITNNKGQQILAGGWWAWLRHPNYLGDLIMCLCWSFYSGLHISVCWVYPVYFTLFIIYRCYQDNLKCEEKHGTAWKQYTTTVKYRLIPFIY